MDEHRAKYRPCAASTTGDLLDCDCGYMTDSMKIVILDMLDDHTLHTMNRSLEYDY